MACAAVSAIEAAAGKPMRRTAAVRSSRALEGKPSRRHRIDEQPASAQSTTKGRICSGYFAAGATVLVVYREAATSSVGAAGAVSTNRNRRSGGVPAWK